MALKQNWNLTEPSNDKKIIMSASNFHETKVRGRKTFNVLAALIAERCDLPFRGMKAARKRFSNPETGYDFTI
jgi:hypothetical protein